MVNVHAKFTRSKDRRAQKFRIIALVQLATPFFGVFVIHMQYLLLS